MAIASYDDLIALIGTWMGRNDLQTQSSNFIRLFESEFNLKLKQLENKISTTLTASSTSRYLSLPSDYRKLDNLAFNTDPRDIQFVPEKLANQISGGDANRQGRPKLFSIVSSSQIELNPRPDSDYSFTLTYYRSLPALGSTNQSNWLLEETPNAYLYGSLKHASNYISDIEKRNDVKNIYDELVRDMFLDDFDRRYGGSAIRVMTTTGNP
jgi:hypothetical protein